LCALINNVHVYCLSSLCWPLILMHLYEAVSNGGSGDNRFRSRQRNAQITSETLQGIGYYGLESDGYQTLL